MTVERAPQVRSTAETLVARPAAEALDFGEYMKQRAVLVNEALERSVPLQYPEVINESMRCARVSTVPEAPGCSALRVRWHMNPPTPTPPAAHD